MKTASIESLIMITLVSTENIDIHSTSDDSLLVVHHEHARQRLYANTSCILWFQHAFQHVFIALHFRAVSTITVPIVIMYMLSRQVTHNCNLRTIGVYYGEYSLWERYYEVWWRVCWQWISGFTFLKIKVGVFAAKPSKNLSVYSSKKKLYCLSLRWWVA